MKKVLVLIFTLIYIGYQPAHTQSVQRLLVLNSGLTTASNGIIRLEAYCTDLTRPAPYGSKFKNVYFGGESTIIRYKENGVVKPPISLDKAIAQSIVTLIGTSATTVTISPGKTSIKLTSVTTKGFWTGETAEPGLLTKEFIEKNKKTDDYLTTRDKIWLDIYNLEKNNPLASKKRMEEYLEYHVKETFKGKDVKITMSDDGKIVIHENKRAKNDFSYSLESLYDELTGEASICVNIDNSGVTLSMTGKINGIMPVEIQYSSDEKISVSAELLTTPDSHNGKNINQATLNVHYENGDRESNQKECRITSSLIICYPLKESSVSVNLCGTEYSISPMGIAINL